MKIGFALEYSLGHITHAENLKRFLASDPTVDPLYVDIPFDSTPMPAHFKPIFKDNWSVRASSAASAALRPHKSSLDVCFFNTQVTSLFSVDIMRSVPSIVSLDATPLQYDSLGSFYKHTPGPAILEAIKKRMNTAAFKAAKQLVTWSQWAKDSLINDYGVNDDKIIVVSPGIDLKVWAVERDATRKEDVTFLFVGGDFERKGGTYLLKAFRKLRNEFSSAKLLVVTKTMPESLAEPGVEVYRGMTPNSPELRALYQRADVFAFPTLGDCLPLAIMEAMAAGLPIITSNVGALSEAVTDSFNGLVVPTADTEAMYQAMRKIFISQDMRTIMGHNAADRANERFDAAKNYGKLIELLKDLSAVNQ